MEREEGDSGSVGLIRAVMERRKSGMMKAKMLSVRENGGCEKGVGEYGVEMYME